MDIAFELYVLIPLFRYLEFRIYFNAMLHGKYSNFTKTGSVVCLI